MWASISRAAARNPKACPPVSARGRNGTFRRALFGLAGVAAVGSWVPRAHACLRPEPEPFSIDPALQGVDVAAPSTPTPIEASVSRWAGEFCRKGTCVASSCGSTASVELRFEPPVDDHTEPTRLGYRLLQVSGYVPPALQPALYSIIHAPLGLDDDFVPRTYYIDVPYQDVVDLDATFKLIAVDRAGNESAPSDPFHAAFDGCTSSPDLDGCIEDIEVETSCSVVPRAPLPAGGWATLVLLGAAFSQRRRARGVHRIIAATAGGAARR